MRHHDEEIQSLWDQYDAASAELVKAKRRLREGNGSDLEVLRLRARLLALAGDLGDRGEKADPVEPGDVPPLIG
jgi:hypothetical protein